MSKHYTCGVGMVQSGQCQSTYNLTLWKGSGKIWSVSPRVCTSVLFYYQLFQSCMPTTSICTHISVSVVDACLNYFFFPRCTTTSIIVNSH